MYFTTKWILIEKLQFSSKKKFQEKFEGFFNFETIFELHETKKKYQNNDFFPFHMARKNNDNYVLFQQNVRYY